MMSKQDSNTRGNSRGVDRTLFFTVGLVLFQSGVNFTVIFPFLGYLVSSFGEWDTATAGFVSGFVLSSMFIGQCVYGTRWGRTSDEYSRKAVLLWGVVSQTLSVFLFGFSRNLWWAILSRSLIGILSSNYPNASAILYEACDGDSDLEAFSSSFIGVASGVGNILGPIIGGLFYDPCSETSPLRERLLLDQDSIFCYYRPLLPCLMASTSGLFVLAIGYFHMPESRSKTRKSFGVRKVVSVVASPMRDVLDWYAGRGKNTSSRTPTFAELRRIPTIYMALLGVLGLSAADVGFIETFPLFAIAPSRLGGLEWLETDVATFFAVANGAAFLASFIFVPMVSITTRPLLYKFSLTLLVPLLLATPLLHRISDHRSQLGVALLLGVLRQVAVGFLYLLIPLFLATSAPAGCKGLLQGYHQSVGAVGRLVMPITMAPAFAWSINGRQHHVFPFNHFFVFVVLAVAAGITRYSARNLNDAQLKSAADSAAASKVASPTAPMAEGEFPSEPEQIRRENDFDTWLQKEEECRNPEIFHELPQKD